MNVSIENSYFKNNTMILTIYIGKKVDTIRKVETIWKKKFNCVQIM